MIDDISEELSITKEDVTIFDDVDRIVSRAVTIGDPLVAFEFGAGIGKAIKVRGLAMAKLLWRIQQSWDLFKVAGTDDDFETMAYMHMGIKPDTNRKYVRMWQAIFMNETLDDDTKRLLQGRNMSDLLRLTAAVRDGSLTGEELREVAETTSSKDLPGKIREKRGEHTSSASAIRIYMQMQSTSKTPAGTVWAQQGDQRATLFVVIPQSTDIGEKALERIVNAAHIQEVYGAA